MTAAGEIIAQGLRHWKLIDSFQRVLASVLAKAPLPETFSDPRRQLDCQSYLSLFLFGLFNPVVESMRALCAITALEKVRRHVGCPKVSLGSFSETQRVLDPDLLKQVFEKLAEQGAREPNWCWHVTPRSEDFVGRDANGATGKSVQHERSLRCGLVAVPEQALR